MVTRQGFLMSKRLRTTALVFGGMAAVIGMAMPAANAAGTGNSVNNCYGIYYSTDWDQKCSSPGAGASGNYRSSADCTASGDNTLTVKRPLYNTQTFDGADCTFQVVYVETSYYPR